jgi:DNA-binding LytR/AlgR family response regulator
VKSYSFFFIAKFLYLHLQMFTILLQPFPSQKNLKQTVVMGFIAGLFVFAVFYFIKPFGLDSFSNAKAAKVALQYALVTIFISLAITLLMPFLFPSLFNERHWKVWHEIVFLLVLILVIALGNVLLTAYIFKVKLTAAFVFAIIKYTLAIGITPILLSVLLKQQSLLSKYSKEAKQIETTLVTPSEETKTEAVEEEIEEQTISEIIPSSTIIIKGTNATEKLELSPNQFLYAEASDNYTNIHFLENELPQKALFRLTIKNLEAQMAIEETIFRCHKSFLVNLTKVAHISGNAQGYKLHLQNSSIEIPVSRTLNAIIKEKFDSLHNKVA